MTQANSSDDAVSILHAQLSVLMRDAVVWIALGSLLLFFLSRPIGRVRFTFSDAFWGSAIGTVIVGILSFSVGFFFSRQTTDGSATDINGIAFIIALAIGCFLQSLVFQITARTHNEVLARWRAITLSLILILGNVLIASPLIELWEHLHK
jgi:hypothetical protein